MAENGYYNKMNDEILIKKCKNGDMEAYGMLVERYMKKAYSTALYFTKNPADAWDVSQEGFLKAWKGMKSFDTKRPFFPWLYTIIKNESIKKFRNNKKKKNLDALPLIVRKTPEEIIEKNEKINKLHSSLEKLDSEKQEIIYMRHFSNMSYREIAEALDIPEGTVMSRLYYARKALLKEYKNE